ncbi:hypothetical protein JOF56_010713 [Kibdelosporangium banguiense]|uniref:Uncharacterized protein n=1 Tax=Kibdelosporangium banguiense TaxID=1365924 RepID=A0ABS4U0Z9_9PSEU|nr:hypothetical protein [Kibdelosporangium banguiense]MBP2330328.1 hypothetical protein [Kibdelosporangium banguiense]
MRTLFEGDVWVHYGQIYVETAEEFPGLTECFAGQRNGLCGAAVPGHLFLITGLHTGEVAFAVEVHESVPALDESWQDVVEVSFRPEGEAALVQWAGENSWPLDLAETDYRVRYCGKGMDQANRKDTVLDDEPVIDRYLLQFWPAPPAPDQVVRQTSEVAAYWHGVAQDQPPPPTPEEKAEAKRLAALEQRCKHEEAKLKAEQREWGGSLPSERLRQLRGTALVIAPMDRPLVDALGAADARTQREVARWVTRRAFVEAQLSEVDWIAAALAAVDQGDPLPPPFDNDEEAWQRLFTDPHVPHTMVTSPDGRLDNCSQQAMAFPAMFSARVEDPLAAAFDALWAGAVAFGHGRHNVLFTEVKEVFPILRQS